MYDVMADNNAEKSRITLKLSKSSLFIVIPIKTFVVTEIKIIGAKRIIRILEPSSDQEVDQVVAKIIVRMVPNRPTIVENQKIAEISDFRVTSILDTAFPNPSCEKIPIKLNNESATA
jgi:hypothetical protein